MHRDVYRAVQRVGLGFDLRLGVDRAASQVKGQCECQAVIVQLQIRGELLQRYLGDNDLVLRKRTLTSMACRRSCTFSCTWVGTWTFSGATRPGFSPAQSRQLIDHEDLRAQISMQHEALTAGVEGEFAARSLSPIKALKSLSVHAVPLRSKRPSRR